MLRCDPGPEPGEPRSIHQDRANSLQQTLRGPLRGHLRVRYSSLGRLERRLLERLFGDDAILFERTQRLQAELLQFAVIGAHRLVRADRPVGDLAHESEERQGRFRLIDLAAEQGHPGTIALALLEKLECIARRAGAAAQYADDEARIISR